MLPVDAETLPARWIVFVAAIAVYAGAVGASFQFDDWNVIVSNPLVQSWPAFWSGMPGIRPLLKATYTASWTAGFGVAGFRVFNIALHAGNALLVLALVRRIAPMLRLAHPSVAALVAALVFALHPAQTEAVTYVSGRSSSLMATFCLAAVLAHLQAAGDPSPLRWRMLSGVAFLAALAVKENAWALPGLILLCEGTRPDFRWRTALARLWPHGAVLVMALVLVLLVPSYWRLLAASLDTRSLGDNLLTQVDGVFHLITGPMLGIDLCIDPDLAVRTAWTPELAGKAAAIGGVLITAVAQWRRRPWLGFGLAWFLVALLPTNSVLPRLDVVNDRQLYLALIGPAIIVGHLVAGRAPRTRWIAAAAVVLLAGTLTVVRNGDYRTEIALWESTVAVSPGKARVWNNLGYAYEQASRRDEAILAYDRALELDPEFWKARLNRQALVE
jgi:protein O-mannosyl-transferase